ncbi:MAG: hypothetical protein G01um101417_116 [Parcubacteria group bacterium Gr01-1014_17]|nr:MAG: hypothetical protein G01um101417_116 [Parcubacteria group bacterium Gr01-1014_17]
MKNRTEKLKPLTRKLTHWSGVDPKQNEVLEFIKHALSFDCSPWPIAISWWEDKYLFRKRYYDIVHEKLVHEDVNDRDLHSCMQIYEFLKSTYRFNVNPLPIMRKHLPMWVWSFQEIEGWDINKPRIFGEDTANGRTWTWVINDYTPVFKVTAFLPKCRT